MSNKLPINWNIYSFREIAEVVTGTTPSTNHAEYYGGSFPFVGPAELGENLITKSSKWLSEIGIMQARILPAETILVCCIGATIGKVGFTGIELATNQQINALICNREIAFPRYVFHYCKTLKSIIRNQGASTTLPLLPKGRFQELKISLPPIDQQRRIAAILDKAEELRRLRRQSIEQLDILSRSIFMEMFGDPKSNPKNWPIKIMADLFLTSPIFGSMIPPVPEKLGWLSIRVGNIQNWSLDLSDKKYIDLQSESIERHRVKDGDLLLARAIASQDHLGKCIIAHPGEETWAFDSHIMRIRFDNNFAEPEFIRHLFMTEGGRSLFLSASRKSTVQFNINTKEIAALKIPVPSITLQQEFAQRIEAIEQLKTKHRESLNHLDNLFASLQHRAFRGEL
jgi:type I restriction enzyme, S subunit